MLSDNQVRSKFEWLTRFTRFFNESLIRLHLIEDGKF